MDWHVTPSFVPISYKIWRYGNKTASLSLQYAKMGRKDLGDSSCTIASGRQMLDTLFFTQYSIALTAFKDLVVCRCVVMSGGLRQILKFLRGYFVKVSWFSFLWPTVACQWVRPHHFLPQNEKGSTIFEMLRMETIQPSCFPCLHLLQG